MQPLVVRSLPAREFATLCRLPTVATGVIITWTRLGGVKNEGVGDVPRPLSAQSVGLSLSTERLRLCSALCGLADVKLVCHLRRSLMREATGR